MADLGKRYSKNLMGINAQGAVSTTHAALTPAAEGNTTFEQTTPAGVVTYVDGTALVAGNSYRLMQLQDGEPRFSIAFKGSDIIGITNVDYDAPVAQVDTITIAAPDIAVAGLKEFTLASRDTTPGNQPFPVTEARTVIRNSTTSIADLITSLVSDFNGGIDYEGNGDEGFATAVGTATTITITGNNTNTHFSTIVGEDLADSVIVKTTPWKQGSGDPDSIAAMEEEFAVFSGATTINAQWEEDYGKPTRFTASGETYGLSIIKYKKSTASMAYANEQTQHVGYIMLANSGGTAVVVAGA